MRPAPRSAEASGTRPGSWDPTRPARRWRRDQTAGRATSVLGGGRQLRGIGGRQRRSPTTVPGHAPLRGAATRHPATTTSPAGVRTGRATRNPSSAMSPRTPACPTRATSGLSSSLRIRSPASQAVPCPPDADRASPAGISKAASSGSGGTVTALIMVPGQRSNSPRARDPPQRRPAPREPPSARTARSTRLGRTRGDSGVSDQRAAPRRCRSTSHFTSSATPPDRRPPRRRAPPAARRGPRRLSCRPWLRRGARGEARGR